LCSYQLALRMIPSWDGLMAVRLESVIEGP
jgi:hypothetical protein